MKLTINTTLITSALLFSLSIQPASAAKLYKWVDENGVVSYQGSPPPSGANIVKEEEIKSSSSSSTNTQTPNGNTEAVTVYTVENCESCELLLLRLQNWNIPTNEQSLQDREIQALILEASQSLQAPTLFINDKFISNLNTNSLISELKQAGYEIEGLDEETESEPEPEPAPEPETNNYPRS